MGRSANKGRVKTSVCANRLASFAAGRASWRAEYRRRLHGLCINPPRGVVIATTVVNFGTQDDGQAREGNRAFPYDDHAAGRRSRNKG